MNVQVRDVMPQDEGVHMLGGNDLHEGAGRQRLERTDAFRLVGPKIREARGVPPADATNWSWAFRRLRRRGGECPRLRTAAWVSRPTTEPGPSWNRVERSRRDCEVVHGSLTRCAPQ